MDGANDVVLSLPNVHEIRAYNRMARLARGDFLLLLQGDHCLPAGTAWASRLPFRHPAKSLRLCARLIGGRLALLLDVLLP